MPDVFACTVRITALDAPGVLSEVSQVLAREGADVARLNASTFPAPFGGTSMCVMEVGVTVRSPEMLDRIGRALSERARAAGWEVVVTPDVPPPFGRQTGTLQIGKAGAPKYARGVPVARSRVELTPGRPVAASTGSSAE